MASRFTTRTAALVPLALVGVSVLTGDKVRIRVIDGFKASIIDTGDDTEFLYLLMPVRV